MNFHNKDWIMQRLKWYYETMSRRYGEDGIFGIFYYGSGNYGIDTEKSDVDAYCLVFPDVADLALNKNPVSYTEVFHDGQVVVKDYRLFFGLLLKQNISCLEILFTDYYLVNKDYEDLWERLKQEREKICYYDVRRMLLGLCGMMYEEVNRLDRAARYCENEVHNKCEGKPLSHLIRLENFYNKFYKKKSTFEEALHGTESLNEQLIKYKTEPISWWEAVKKVGEYDNKVDDMREEIELNRNFGVCGESKAILQSFQRVIFYRFLKEDLGCK